MDDTLGAEVRGEVRIVNPLSLSVESTPLAAGPGFDHEWLRRRGRADVPILVLHVLSQQVVHRHAAVNFPIFPW